MQERIQVHKRDKGQKGVLLRWGLKERDLTQEKTTEFVREVMRVGGISVSDLSDKPEAAKGD